MLGKRAFSAFGWLNIFAASWVGQALVRYLADGDGGTRAYVHRTDIASPTAMRETAGPIEYIPETGESLSVGSGTDMTVRSAALRVAYLGGKEIRSVRVVQPCEDTARIISLGNPRR